MHMSEVLFIWMTTNGLEMNVQIAFSLESIESIQTTDRVRRVVLLINGRFNYLSVPCWHRKEECERYYHYTESLIDLTRTWPLRIRKTISYDSIGRPIITHDLYQDSFLLSNGNCIPFVVRFSWWYFIYCQRESIIIWEYSKKTYFQVFKWAEVNENEWESVGLKRELWKSMKWDEHPWESIETRQKPMGVSGTEWASMGIGWERVGMRQTVTNWFDISEHLSCL